MGSWEAQFSPTGMMAGKAERVAECFMGEISDLSEVSYDKLWEVARRIFAPTPAEKAEDDESDRRLRQEARDERQDDAIRQGEVQDGGTYF
ncbi:hypothetical protein [Herbidospora cretacea]|uniref:hypothetical protein n=1 Tax=Herbidospora cretacea TaxID=28444 RepID=UPI0004C39F69|nr:hypothetical protein [Herbidospora cretacea]